MKRLIKNVVMLVLIVVLAGTSVFTINLAVSGQNPSGMISETGGGTPPDMNNNSNMQEPPEKPDGSSQNTGGDVQQMPDTNSSVVPQMPSGSSQAEMNPQSQMGQTNQISLIYYIALGVQSFFIALLIIYLIMSRFNKKTLKETFINHDKITIYILSIIILTTALTCVESFTTNKLQNNNVNPNTNEQMNTTTVSTQGSIEVEDTQTLSDQYETSESDTSVILVKNGGTLTLKDATLTKSNGDSSNTENSEFYGVNAGILVTENSSATIENTTISTNAKGSNAVFSTGSDSKIYINDSIVTTSGESSARGLDATYGGYIEASRVTVTTQGGSCAALATDRGEGTVIANNSTLETNGVGSPAIYSTGDIQITNTTGVANHSQMVVIEGKNSATVTDSTLTASGTGNRGDVDQSGIMIYQSMSGDANEGTGTFTATNSKLSIQSDSSYYQSAPMFFITNTDAKINLNHCTLNYGSHILVSIKGTSEWGNSGSNGGDVEFNATDQTLDGDIELDNISTLHMNLTSSSYKGTINADNTAKEISISLDKDSTLTLTGDSYITSLNNKDSSNSNINFNGYKLYVNGKAI